MQFNIHTQTVDIGNGRTATIETGKMARQADGAVVVRVGNCMLLATAVASEKPKDGVDFFPLTVEYQEKFAAAGRIPGSFHRREGRASDYEVLICRIVDRAIRPMFADNFVNDTQVLIYLISADENVEPDSLVGLAASAALSISSIPFEGPISEVRVTKIGDNYVVNPTPKEAENATLNIILAGTVDNILMVEGEAKEASEAELIAAIKAGHEIIIKQCEAQVALQQKCGKPKMEVVAPIEDEVLYNKVKEYVVERIETIAQSALGKHERKGLLKLIKEDFIAKVQKEIAEKIS